MDCWNWLDWLDIVHYRHSFGASVAAAVVTDTYGAFGALQLCVTAGHAQLAISDTFFAFKSQLCAFIDYLDKGIRPFPWNDTEELMKMLIAGIRSREEVGREVLLSELGPCCNSCGGLSAVKSPSELQLRP